MMIGRPASLTTQLALVMTIAVLAAAAVQLVVLMAERNRTDLIEFSGPAITRFADMSSEAMNRGVEAIQPNDARSFRRRGARILIAERSMVETRNLSRQDQLERRLQRAMEELGHPNVRVMAATRIIDVSSLAPNGPRPFGPRQGERDADRRIDGNRKIREIVLTNEIAPDRWISGVFLAPQPPNDEFTRLFLGALVAIGCVLGAAIWISMRLVRPLSDLASAASKLGNAPTPEKVEERGPREIRHTLAAFNAMSGRVSHLLREKDVMLGALGHDLRTPLASLRIRVESMEPETERDKAIATIEETTRLLESILDFARTGEATNNLEDVDLAVLASELSDAYRERGITVEATSEPEAVRCHTNPDLVRRLLQNLIDNAARYGEQVSLVTRRADGVITVTVTDDGPGIPEDQLALVKQPFYRGDASRNRQYGGAGLGLALADTIANALNGELTLTNVKPSGLRATLTLPASTPMERRRD